MLPARLTLWSPWMPCSMAFPTDHPVSQSRRTLAKTPLHDATLTNKIGIVDSLVSHGANLGDADSVSGATALINASKNANAPMMDVMHKSKGWNEALLFQIDFRGNTALHHAVATNSKEAVKLLLELGAGNFKQKKKKKKKKNLG